MNLFVDANILISVLNKEYPLFTYSARILSLAGNSKYNVLTSPLCLAIAFYFAEKKNKKTAPEKINQLIEHLQITTVNHEVVCRVKNNTAIHNFEDGLQYYSALDSQCKYIITEDTKDFYFSEILVLNAETFITEHFRK